MKKQLMTLANILRKAGKTMSDALKSAWAAMRAKVLLDRTDERGIWLVFKKVDGTVRSVLATRNLAHVPADKQPKQTGKPAGNTITYFDIWEQAWKSFRADSLISIG